MIVSREALAWLRAHEVAGVELPADVAQVAENLAAIEAQYDALPAPDPVPSAATLVAAGTPLGEAAGEVERLARAQELLAEQRKIALDAVTLARGTLSRLIAEARDSLIADFALPAVDDLIAKARPLAETLARFAPKHDAASIAREATPAELKSFQTSIKLESEFGSLVAAHRASLKSAFAQGGYASGTDAAAQEARSADQSHRFWLDASQVADDRLAGRALNARGFAVSIEPSLLGVAAETEATFRLASVAELAEAFELDRRRIAEERAEAMGQRPRRRMIAL